MYRGRGATLQVLLVHPGGPLWAGKDDGAWSIPKGIADEGEDLLAAARREFQEETGFDVGGDFTAVGEFKQPSGKIVVAWAVLGDLDAGQVRSNTFAMEWPPRSGKTAHFPEIDRAAWFSLDEAARKISKGQRPIIDALARRLAAR